MAYRGFELLNRSFRSLQSPLITLRSATVGDAPLFYSVISLTMRHFIISTWGRWDDERVLREAKEDCMLPGAQVILSGDEQAGVLCVGEEITHLQVQQFYLLPFFQRKGIGTELMNSVLRQAREQGKPVRLKVLRVNPAKQFYEKLGFMVTEEADNFYNMQSTR